MATKKTATAMYDELVAAIVKAVPGIREHHDRCMNCGYGLAFCKKLPATEWGRPACKPNESYSDRPITFEDVLRTIKQKYKDARIEWESSDDNGLQGFYVYSGTDSALFTFLYFGRTLSWLHDNDPQAIASLHSLLCHE